MCTLRVNKLINRGSGFIDNVDLKEEENLRIFLKTVKYSKKTNPNCWLVAQKEKIKIRIMWYLLYIRMCLHSNKRFAFKLHHQICNKLNNIVSVLNNKIEQPIRQ